MLSNSLRIITQKKSFTKRPSIQYYYSVGISSSKVVFFNKWIFHCKHTQTSMQLLIQSAQYNASSWFESFRYHMEFLYASGVTGNDHTRWAVGGSSRLRSAHWFIRIVHLIASSSLALYSGRVGYDDNNYRSKHQTHTQIQKSLTYIIVLGDNATNAFSLRPV